MDHYEPSALYYHEALDRAHVARDHFFEYVGQHPAVMNDQELRGAADKVTALMGDFYQLVGEKYAAFEDKEEAWNQR